MPGIDRIKAALATIETTYKTPAVSTDTDGVVLVNPTVTAVEPKVVERGIVKPSMGTSPSLVVSYFSKFDSEIEFAASGTKGQAPAYGPLLRACGYAQTITVGSKVEYTPVSSNFESLTIRYYWLQKLRTLLGVRGNFSLSIKSGEVPHFKFALQGLFGGIADQMAPPATTLNAYKNPLPVNVANTLPASLFGITVPFHEFNYDNGYTVTHRNLPGMEDVLLEDRTPKGNIIIDDPALATKDFFSSLIGAELGALNITHGMVPGSILMAGGNNVQIVSVAEQAVNGYGALNLGLKFNVGSANDEFKFTSM